MIEVYEGSVISCGVCELSGVTDTTPEKILKDVSKQCGLSAEKDDKPKEDRWGYYDHDYSYKVPLPAFFTFSDIYNQNKGGQAFADFIKKHKLGTIVESTVRKNKNSGNRIRVWIWGPNATAIRAWGRTEKENKKNERASRNRRNSRSKL